MSALMVALLIAAPFPAWSQVGRITFEAPTSPTLSFSAGAVNPGGVTALIPASTPDLARALAPILSAPSAQPQFSAPVPIYAAQPVPRQTAAIVPASAVARVPSNGNQFQLIQNLAKTVETVEAAPERIGKLYDAAPAAPDFDALTTVKTPEAPAPWRPSSMLLKPAAAVANAWRLSRYEKKLRMRGPEERVTTEEMGLKESLSVAHEALKTDRLQDALEELTRLFRSREANRWYRANPAFQPYQNQGHAYIRFVERAVKLAYERAHERSFDATLIAEVRAAGRAGAVLGHDWRATAIQERDSAHCAHHALFNAIQASVGFVYPMSVHRFIERAREVLNVRGEKLTGLARAEHAALENSLGFKLGNDVGEGMGTEAIKRWAQLLGMSVSARGPPQGDAQWSALIGRGREVLISLRMFHERFKHDPAERDLHGHEYRVLHHEVYLLGAFDSPSRGARLYMVQDSGSGATDFYTAEELSAVTSDLQIVGAPSAISLP